MSTFTVSAVFKAIDQFTRPLQKMERSTRTFAQSSESVLSNANRAFRKLTPSIGGVSTELLKFAATGAIVAGVFTQFEKIKDFETGLVGVGKTANIEGEELVQFGKKALELSNELKGISTQKIFEVAGAAGQLGVKGSENILKFSKVMVLLEKSTDVVGEEGAKSIARILNVTGEGVQVIDKFGASLVALGNNSAASEGEILSMANEVGRAGASFDLLSTDILGISAGLVSLGAKPEAAGTAVGKLFAQIEGAVNSGGKDLENFAKVLGVTSDEVKVLFAKDKSKLFTKFAQGIEGIKNNGGSLITTFDGLGLSGERTIKSLAPMANNSKLIADAVALSSLEFEKNTALNIEAATALNTVQSAGDAVVQSFDNLITSAFNSNDGFSVLKSSLFFLAKNMKILVSVATTYIAAMIALKVVTIAGTIALGAYNIAQGITAAVTGTSALAFEAGTIAYIAFRTAIIAGTVATWLATTATAAFGAVMAIATGPIGWVIIGIVALVAAVYWLTDGFKGFGDFFIGLWNGIVDFFENLHLFDILINEMNEVMPGMGDAVYGFFEGMFEGIYMVFIQPLVNAWELVAGLFGGDVDTTGLDKVSNKINGLERTINANANVNVDEATINAQNSRQENLVRSIEERNQNLNIDINDGTRNGVSVRSEGDSIAMPNVKPSFV